MALTDIAQRNFAITTIAMESVGWVTKTVEVDHASGWLPGQQLFGLTGGAGTANTKIPTAVLIEKDLVGETVHDTYDTNEALLVWYPQPSDRGAMRLKDGTSIAEGDYVVPAGSGNVEKYASASHDEFSILGVAAGTLDVSGGSAGGINLVEVLFI